MSTLFDIWHTTQARLFPWLEERLDPLSEKEQRFVQVVALMDLNKHMREYLWIGIGRKREDRASIAKAFVAKAVYNFETTKVLIEYLCGCKNLRRLCGWETRGDIPSESTFSRAFAEYSRGCLPQKIHEAMSLGFVSRMVERDMLMDTALEFARNMNHKNPAGLRLTKEAININMDISGLEQALGVENRNQALIYAELFKGPA